MVHDQPGEGHGGAKGIGGLIFWVGGINFVVGYKRWRLNFICITVNVSVGLSSERETATAKYVGVNKLSREILIKIAPLHNS